MIQRRIWEHLECQQPLATHERQQLTEWLQTRFVKQFISSIDYQTLIDSLQVKIINRPCVLFKAGQPVQCYYWFVGGKIRTSEWLEGQKVTVGMLEGQDIIGEFFYDIQHNRLYQAQTISKDQGCVIVSINKNVYHQICQKQMEQFCTIKEAIINFLQIDSLILENQSFYKNLKLRKTTIHQSLNDLAQYIFVIIQGQYLMETTHRQSIRICQQDCINVQSYIAHLAGQQIQKYNYRALSSQNIIVGIKFQFLANLPVVVQKKLKFMYRCHKISLDESNYTSLPKLQKHNYRLDNLKPTKDASKHDSVYRPAKHESVYKCYSNCRSNNIDDISEFRKLYSLGYSDKQNQFCNYQSKRQSEQSELKGYFMYPTRKSHAVDMSLVAPRRQWSKYIEAHFQEKKKKYQKQHGKMQALLPVMFVNKSKSNYNLQAAVNKLSSLTPIPTYAKASKKLYKCKNKGLPTAK